VKHGGELSGLITERDMVTRVVSKGLDPTNVTVREVMSSPLITISEEASVEAAAKKMRENGIRRLVVESNHRKVGMITESDMIRVNPELHFLIRERSKLEARLTSHEPQELTLAGFCEQCGNYSDRLKNINGQWLGRECAEAAD
jgi:signal-transduction protein with cAMP-binding, CBS, and nucleotidyltransferase domain